jgi:hypothetical protein
MDHKIVQALDSLYTAVGLLAFGLGQQAVGGKATMDEVLIALNTTNDLLKELRDAD